MVAASGAGAIGATTGDEAIRWSSPKDYTNASLFPANQVIDRTVKAPMKFCLDNFNSTKLGNVVLAPGDPETRVHELIAIGMVRKTMLNIVETVTEVEWSETKITHKYRTNAISGPPCCCIHGYGALMSVEAIGSDQTRLINRAYQDARCCMPGTLCLCCLCWDKIGNSFLKKDIDELEAKWAAQNGAGSGARVTPS